MNFFAQEEHARRSSRRFVLLFVLAVIAVIVAIDVVAVVVGWGTQTYTSAATGQGVGIHTSRLDYVTLAWISVATLAVIGVASLYRSISLRSGGGAAVARSLGATPVPPDTDNFAWKRLRNVIEEIAIASGVPVPEIFVMENEAGINAFAAGYSPGDAAVCVTQGCLDKLTRDEMQGVIAHEFSHVLNGDMRLNIRLIGLLFGILVIGMLGRLLMYSGGRVSSGRSRSNGNGAVYIAVVGIALLIIGYVGFFFGRLIQAAVARSRETLADASAVQFTRQCSGIAGALKKIAALSEGSALVAQQKQEVAHMLFGEGSDAMSWFATHPPLLQRIKTLDPAFHPDELVAITHAWQQPRQETPSQQAADDDDDDDTSLAGFTPLIIGAAVAAGATSGNASLPAAGATTRLDVNAVTAQVATPGADDYRAAFGLHRSIPTELQNAARDPQQAPAVVLALALSRGPDGAGARRQQLEALRRNVDDGTVERVAALAKLADGLHPMLRLPLASLAFPTLRKRPRAQLQKFIAQLQTLIEADGQTSLDEYCLAKLVQVQVLDALDPGAAFARSRVKLADCIEETRDLFALVAYYGNDDPERAKQAFLHAVNEAMPEQNLLYARPDAWQASLDAALLKLDRLGPPGKELVVRGLTRAISDDGVVTLAESELLRMVCAALHCPLPPMLQTANAA